MARSVDITFTEEARESIRKAMTQRGLELPEPFISQSFVDCVAKLEVEQGFVFLTLDDGTIYGYNANTVARIKSIGGVKVDS